MPIKEHYHSKSCPGEDFDWFVCPDLQGGKMKMFSSGTENDDYRKLAKGKSFYIQISKCNEKNKLVP